jgi:hypothetical protein
MIIDDVRLKQIENRLNAITTGKWIYEAGDDTEDHFISTSDGTYIAQTTYDTLSYSQQHNVSEDSIFIANAPEDIAYLLKLVKQYLK